MTNHVEQVFEQAKYIAKYIFPELNERAAAVHKALKAAAHDGDIEKVIELLENNRVLYHAKTPWGRRGVMTIDVKILADNLLAKIDRYELRPAKTKREAA